MKVEKYCFKTEFHAHTNPVSGCSEISPEVCVKNYADSGYNSIIISNHFSTGTKFYGEKEKCLDFYFSDFDKAKEEGEKCGINVILGCEIRFSENFNDYLLFGIDKNTLVNAYDYLELGIEKFSKDFRSEKTVILQAHPFRNGMTEVLPSLLDGIESFNMHPNHNSRVAMAAKYAEENNFLVSAGTDYHHLGHEGMVAVLSKTEIKDSFDAANLLKSRDYIFKIGKSIVLPYGKV